MEFVVLFIESLKTNTWDDLKLHFIKKDILTCEESSEHIFTLLIGNLRWEFEMEMLRSGKCGGQCTTLSSTLKQKKKCFRNLLPERIMLQIIRSFDCLQNQCLSTLIPSIPSLPILGFLWVNSEDLFVGHRSDTVGSYIKSYHHAEKSSP